MSKVKQNIEKYFIIFVGLPARGKSFLANKIQTLFDLSDTKCAIFNLGNYRRKISTDSFDHTFFSAENKEGNECREKCAALCLLDALKFLDSVESGVVLYDGTNSSIERRSWLRSQLIKMDYKLIWIEMFVDDDTICRDFILTSKVNNGDYNDIEDSNIIYEDFMQRIDEYKKTYIPITDNEKLEANNQVFVNILNIGQEVTIKGDFIEKSNGWDLIKDYLLEVYTRKKVVKVNEVMTDKSFDAKVEKPTEILLSENFDGKIFLREIFNSKSNKFSILCTSSEAKMKLIKDLFAF